MCFPTISQHKCDICRNLTKFLISRELQLRSAWDEHLREYKSPKLSRLLDTDAIRNKRMMITIFSKNHPHSDDDDRQTSVWLSLTMRVNWHKSHWSFLPPLICLTIYLLVDYYFLTHSISNIPLLSGKLEDHNHNNLTFAGSAFAAWLAQCKSQNGDDAFNRHHCRGHHHHGNNRNHLLHCWWSVYWESGRCRIWDECRGRQERPRGCH